jgi:hypothetical protein
MKTRYLVWASALGFCGALLSLKATDASPPDIIFGLITGAAAGTVIAGCIEVKSEMSKAYGLADYTTTFKTVRGFLIVILSVCAIVVFLRIAQILITGRQ